MQNNDAQGLPHTVHFHSCLHILLLLYIIYHLSVLWLQTAHCKWPLHPFLHLFLLTARTASPVILFLCGHMYPSTVKVWLSCLLSALLLFPSSTVSRMRTWCDGHFKWPKQWIHYLVGQFNVTYKPNSLIMEPHACNEYPSHCWHALNVDCNFRLTLNYYICCTAAWLMWNKHHRNVLLVTYFVLTFLWCFLRYDTNLSNTFLFLKWSLQSVVEL